MQKLRVAGVDIIKQNQQGRFQKADLLAVEEPLEIRLNFGTDQQRIEKSLAVTMRTPGHDFELAMGFLFTEGIIRSFDDVLGIVHCEQVKSEAERGNVVRVSLTPQVEVNLSKAERNFYATSSCGVCGKESIEALRIFCDHIESNLTLSSDKLERAPEQMREEQRVFEHTGGLHAAALFDQNGELLLLREDIGRHNALDKLIGAALAKGWVPLANYFIVVSGRIGFELVQKSIAAGLSILSAVGAPSSLAVKLAKTFGLTLVGFIRNRSFNIYSGQERVYENKN